MKDETLGDDGQVAEAHPAHVLAPARSAQHEAADRLLRHAAERGEAADQPGRT